MRLVNALAIARLVDAPMLGGGGAAWTPAQLFSSSEVGCWYDPSDASTCWQDTAATTSAADGDVVGRIDDLSGNGLNAIQATAARKPIRRTAGGVWYLDFDGSDDYLQIGSGATPLGATLADVLVGAAYREVTRQVSVLFSLSQEAAGGNAATRWHAHAPYSDGTGYFDTGGATAPNRVSGSWPVAAGNDLVATFKGSTTDSEQFFRVDGTQVAGDATGHSVTATDNAYLASRKGVGASRVEYMAVRLHAFVAVLSAEPTSEIQNLETWLASKNGATL